MHKDILKQIKQDDELYLIFTIKICVGESIEQASHYKQHFEV